jgi:hypothetical protein
MSQNLTWNIKLHSLGHKMIFLVTSVRFLSMECIYLCTHRMVLIYNLVRELADDPREEFGDCVTRLRLFFLKLFDYFSFFVNACSSQYQRRKPIGQSLLSYQIVFHMVGQQFSKKNSSLLTLMSKPFTSFRNML